MYIFCRRCFVGMLFYIFTFCFVYRNIVEIGQRILCVYSTILLYNKTKQKEKKFCSVWESFFFCFPGLCECPIRECESLVKWSQALSSSKLLCINFRQAHKIDVINSSIPIIYWGFFNLWYMDYIIWILIYLFTQKTNGLRVPTEQIKHSKIKIVVRIIFKVKDQEKLHQHTACLCVIVYVYSISFLFIYW